MNLNNRPLGRDDALSRPEAMKRLTALRPARRASPTLHGGELLGSGSLSRSRSNQRLPALVAATLLGLFPLIAADSPHLIPFQGNLAQPALGDAQQFEPVPSGQYDIIFTLYAAPVGGESKVWGPERHTRITVINGLVNAMLGSVIGFQDEITANPNFFNRPLYVGITVDSDGNPNTADLELIPRQVLLPAAQSLNATKLDGSDWQDFFVGTDSQGAFTAGITKARDADLFDGIDAAAVFVDPTEMSSPKVKLAEIAEGIAGDLNLTGSLDLGGNLDLAGNLTIDGTVQSPVESVVNGVSFFMVPRGSIVIWSGEISAIPEGWAFCDGANGTPDLRSRFVYGHPNDNDTVVGQTGGASSHTHDVNIPSFTSGSTSANRAYTAIENGASVFRKGSHSHSVNPPNTTSTTTGHLPPYVYLAYIMRL